MIRILHLDFLGYGKDEEYSFNLAGASFLVRRTALQRDYSRLKKLLLHHSEDAVALSGLTLNLYFEDKLYPYRKVARTLQPLIKDICFSDGSLVRETLEKYLVLSGIKSLSYNFRDRRTLIFSALTRFGATEVLASYTNKLIIGDLLWGLRVGVPIFSLSTFKRYARALIELVSMAPPYFSLPEARGFRRIFPRFRWYFHWAEVILGGIEYFLRYSPPLLADKVVFTDAHSEGQLEFLKERGVATVINLLPKVDGVRLSRAVLGAALEKLTQPSASYEEVKEKYLNFYLKEHFEPEIIHFKQEPDVEPTLIDRPAEVYLTGQARVQENDDKQTRKFAFIVHPLTYSHLLRHPRLRMLDRYLPQSVVEGLAARLKPVILGEVRNVVSPLGARAEGIIYALPMTSKLLLRTNPELVYRRILSICEMAKNWNAQIIGLGAYTSIVGDAGKTIAMRSPVPVTTGNSFTVAVTIETMKRSAELMGIMLSRSTACVVGATGSIGRILSLIIGGMVRKLIVCAPRSERLLWLSKQIRARYPELELHLSTSFDKNLSQADILVTTTSAIDPIIRVENLKPGALVLDVARPPDVSEESAKLRPDVLVIESGEVKLPEGAYVTCDLGLPKNVVYACLAETIILALSDRFESFTIGRDISEEKVKLISELGLLHGFGLSAIRSFGRELSEEEILSVRDRAKSYARA